jgi:hypothetical protein
MSSFSAEVRDNPFFIGKKGASIKKICDSASARTNDDKDKEVITIIGKKEAVETAKQQLEAIIKEVNNNTEGDKHFLSKHAEVIGRISGVTRSTEVDSQRTLDIVTIDKQQAITNDASGEKCEKAKQALIDLVPLDVPFDLHRELDVTKVNIQVEPDSRHEDDDGMNQLSVSLSGASQSEV